MRLGRYTLNVVATLAIALLMTRWFVRLPIESPIPSLIQSAMTVLGVDVIARADDIEPIGLLVVLVAALAISAMLVWAINQGYRMFVKRSAAH